MASIHLLRTLPFLLPLLAAACFETPVPPTYEAPEEEHLPDQEAWDTTIYLLQDNRQRVVATAGHRVHHPATQQTVIDEGLRVEFYDEEGRHASTLAADRGVIDEQSRDMSAIGRVVVVSPEHGALETDSLRWTQETNRIATDAPVRITTEKDTITGIGFEADPGLREWEIRRDVRGRLDRQEELSKHIDEPE